MNEIKDRYFFIDYLRLHKYGKDLKIWKKNRNMLVKEDEYNSSIRARKGYTSYIQRCFKSILEYLYPDFDIIKPRGVFGYELGTKNIITSSSDFLSSSSEGKIRFIIQRHLLNENNYREIVEEYAEKLRASNSTITTKNYEAGLCINLSHSKSKGFSTIKKLEEIRLIQNKMITLYDNKEEAIGIMLSEMLKKTRRKQDGVRVGIKNREGELEREARIETAIKEDDRLTYKMYDEDRNYSSTEFIYLPEGSIVPNLEEIRRELILEIIEYANHTFIERSNLPPMSILKLSRSAILKDADNQRRRQFLDLDLREEDCRGLLIFDDETEEETENNIDIPF